MARVRGSGRLVVVGAAAALLGCGGAAGPAPTAPTEARAEPLPAGVEMLTPEASPLALRRSPLADEYFWLRAKTLEGDVPQSFTEALAAMQSLRSDLSQDASAWEDLELPLGSAESVADLEGSYRALPEVLDVDGRTITLRAGALRLARALASTQRDYRTGPFRASSAAISAAASEIGRLLLPRIEQVLGAIEQELGLPGAPRPLVLTLVGDAPYPSIFAADDRGRTHASFVRVRGLTGGALVETLLHEVLHAMDELTVRESTAMNTLRAALRARGLGEDDPNVEMAVNTVTVAEAASLVRRFVDASHKPLGESGFYMLFPPATEIVAAWDRHLAGASIDETASAIAKAVAPAPAP